MKKFIVCFVFTAALFLTGTQIYAQNGNGDKSQMKEMMKQRLKDSVGLSDVQVDSVISIREEMQPKMKAVMKDESLMLAKGIAVILYPTLSTWRVSPIGHVFN